MNCLKLGVMVFIVFSAFSGMDVHDSSTMSRTRPLEPSMVVTNEPGLYFPPYLKVISREELLLYDRLTVVLRERRRKLRKIVPRLTRVKCYPQASIAILKPQIPALGLLSQALYLGFSDEWVPLTVLRPCSLFLSSYLIGWQVGQMVHADFVGLGMRVEDDVLITVEGSEVLTTACPVEIRDLEKLAAV